MDAGAVTICCKCQATWRSEVVIETTRDFERDSVMVARKELRHQRKCACGHVMETCDKCMMITVDSDEFQTPQNVEHELRRVEAEAARRAGRQVPYLSREPNDRTREEREAIDQVARQLDISPRDLEEQVRKMMRSGMSATEINQRISRQVSRSMRERGRSFEDELRDSQREMMRRAMEQAGLSEENFMMPKPKPPTPKKPLDDDLTIPTVDQSVNVLLGLIDDVKEVEE